MARRHPRRLRALPLCLPLVGGCFDIPGFPCTGDADCAGVADAVCTEAGACAVPDNACPSGLRYHERAASGVAGRCAPASTDGTSTSTGDGTSSSTGAATPGASGTGEDSGTATGGLSEPCIETLSAAGTHNCVIRSDGAVVCWGGNLNRELGLGAPGDTSPEPRVVPVPLGFGTAAKLFLGKDHVCAVDTEGAGACWGLNADGQVDPFRPSATPSPPTLTSWVGPLDSLAIGARHTCAASDDGTWTTCWGANDRGRLGTSLAGPGPHSVEDPMDALVAVRGATAGTWHSCVLVDGDAWCWGDDSQGQLGNGPGDTSGPTPRRVPITSAVEELGAGDIYTCVRTQGSVQCWGDGTRGQLGDGNGMSRAAPVTVDLAEPAEQLRVGPDLACVLDAQNQVQCWGNNTRDLFQAGAMTPQLNRPRALPQRAALPSVELLEIAVGRWHVCALSEAGQVWCWGDNDLHQLGNSERTVKANVVPGICEAT